MKNVKTIISGILFIIVIIFIFAACSDTSDKKTNVTSLTTSSMEDIESIDLESNYLAAIPDVDLDGFVLSMIHYNNTWLSWAQNILDAETLDGDLLNDAVYERNLYIKERFNCDLNIAEADQMDPIVPQLALSGDSTYDVVFMYDLRVLNHLDYIMKWNDIPYIDLTAPWWNPDATSLYNIGGKQVAVCGDFSISVLSRAAGYVFNKDLYNQFGLEESIYDAVRDGTWTIDKMYDVAKMAVSDINGDGVFDTNDRYGISGSVKEHYSRLLEGSGIQYIKKDNEGYPVFSLPTDGVAITKMQKIIEMNRNNEIFQFDPSSQHNGAAGDLFRNARVLFDVAPVLSIEKLRDVEFELGVIPVPKYDVQQDRYYAPSFGAEVQMMVRSFDISRAENVGLLLEAMSIHSHYNLLEIYKEVMLKTKYSRDNESEDMLDIIFNSIWFEFGINAWQEYVASPLFDKVFMTLNDTLISSLASMESTVNAQIDKLKIAIDNME